MHFWASVKKFVKSKMESRGQKRSENGEELPADKRACSSSEFRPSTSSLSQTPPENNEEDHADHTDTESEGGEPENNSANGDEGEDDQIRRRHNQLRHIQRQRASGEHGKFLAIMSSLSQEVDLSRKLIMLTELCEALSFCTEDLLSGGTSKLLTPILVKLARDETSADIMLLAVRAMTYLCDVYPKSSAYLVRYDAVPILCQRLLEIEYMDVAEQCLQALEKISQEQPLACLQAGAIMAVLNYIDFFSTSIHRVALSTVVNICKKLPSESPSPFMDAVPILCNLLQYDDPKLVESVVICLIRITETVSQSSGLLDELCKHGLIRQATQYLSLNSRTTLSQPVHNGLIWLLVKLSSGSFVAFRTLYELNISSILRGLLSTDNLLHGMSTSHVVDGHCYQVYEILKLLNELLPASTRTPDSPQLSEKEFYLINHPELLQKFGMDLLPLLIQVVNSGPNSYICYGCLSVINKLIYLSTSDVLVELLKNANISSFLAGVFTRKDPHILIPTLQIAELILQKFSTSFLDLFIKEGVSFAIDALLSPEKCSLESLNKCPKLVFPVSSGTRLLADSSQKPASKEILRCLCYAFPSSSPGSNDGRCMLEKDSVYNLAKHVRNKYFAPYLSDPANTQTAVLQELRTFSASLSDLMNLSLDGFAPDQHEESFYAIMNQVMEKLSGTEPISTFEFIESGIVKSLMTYLSNDRYVRRKREPVSAIGDFYAVEKRFEVLARLLFSSRNLFSGDLPIITLTRRLQSSLSTLESFPVILSCIPEQRNSYATVPHDRHTAYPCMRVQFVRDKEETSLGDCSGHAFAVDPFSSLDAIEGFLWPKFNAKQTSHIKSANTIKGQLESAPSSGSSSRGSQNGGEFERMSTDLPGMKANKVNLTQPELEQEPRVGQANPGTSVGESFAHFAATLERDLEAESDEDMEMEEQHTLSCSYDDTSPKLMFYLEGKQLERSLTLYQAILQQQMTEYETITSSSLWSKMHMLTYKKAVGHQSACDDGGDQAESSAESSAISDKAGVYALYASLFSPIFPCELSSDLEKSNPIYDVIYLLKSLERMNKFIFHLMSRQKICAFAEGSINDLDTFQIAVTQVPPNEFINSKLTEKLEQHMLGGLAVSVGGMPLWCNQLMESCPFLFSFEAKCKYFRLAAFVPQLGQSRLPSHTDSGMTSDRRQSSGGSPRKKFLVYRNQILDSAAQIMDLHAFQKVLLEVEYDEEVGTGLGPTLEFYTLVSHEFQKSGLGMWREDESSFITGLGHARKSEILICPCGLFPRPWASTMEASDGIQFSEVIKKFTLLGKFVGKALQDRRVLDLHFSKAFYKLMLGQELGLYDIQSFEPVLGRTLLEFKALVERKRFLESVHGENQTSEFNSCFRKTKLEDLCLDFTVPGYPDFVLASGFDHEIVNLSNLEQYVSLMVDATINSGISRQVEAFKSGLNKVFPIEHLQIFTEEELERILCGERDSWAFNDLLDHIKFDHGYTASSPPIVNLLEIIHELDQEHRRAFLQFVTGAPRLPPGGFASLNPKLTVVRKHSSNLTDLDLPSVMTCANYLKLPPYSSKEKMKEKLIYAIKEGQGSFHLS